MIIEKAINYEQRVIQYINCQNALFQSYCDHINSISLYYIILQFKPIQPTHRHFHIPPYFLFNF